MSDRAQPCEAAPAAPRTLAALLARLRGDGSGALLTRSALGTAVARVGAHGLAIAGQIVAARLAGAQAFGDYAYVFTWVSILALLGKGGLDTSSVRYVATYWRTEDWSRLRGFLRFGNALVWLASLAVAGIAALAAWRFGGRLGPLFALGCAALPLLAAVQVRESQLRGFHRVVLGVLPDAIGRPLLAMGALGALALAGRSVGAAELVLVEGAGLAVVFAVGTGLLARVRRPLAAAEPRLDGAPEWLRVSLTLLVIAGLHQVVSQTGILVAGARLGTPEAGAFRVATQLSSLVPFFLHAVDAVIAPLVAGLHAQGKGGEIQRLLTRASRAVVVLTLPLGLAGVIFADPLLGLYGEAFRGARAALVLLIVGQLCNVATGPVAPLLMMMGHERFLARLISLTALGNLALNLALVPVLGLTGAGLATALATILWNAACTLFAIRSLGLDPTPLGWLGRGRRAA